MRKKITEVTQHVAFLKVKHHIQDHQNVYLAAGSGLIVGALLRGRVPEVKQTIGSFNYKSTTTNVVTTTLERRGHPGFKIQNNKTGEIVASLNRMAEVDQISRTLIRKNMLGESSLYTNLGEIA